MNTTIRQWAVAVMCLLSATASQAAEPALKVGDPAPKLQAGRWVQGEAVKEFEKGKAYVVEFWATWCGPCRTSIPHLNELHKKFESKGLVVIGQDCWEQDESKVEPFLKTMGNKMTYRVALDDKSESKKGQMAENWMDAAGQDGIPTAFIVDPKGTLAWVGHPMSMNEVLVESILSGKHDLAKALATFLEANKRSEEWRAAQIPRSKVYAAINKKDWAEAEAKLAEAAPVLSKEDTDGLRLAILMARKDYRGVQGLLEQLYDTVAGRPPAESASRLNQIAWEMAITPDLPPAELERAEKIARWADAAGGHKDPMILDTVARVLFRRDKRADAIGLQEKAVGLADESSRPMYQGTLDSYRKGELPKAN